MKLSNPATSRARCRTGEKYVILGSFESVPRPIGSESETRRCRAFGKCRRVVGLGEREGEGRGGELARRSQAQKIEREQHGKRYCVRQAEKRRHSNLSPPVGTAPPPLLVPRSLAPDTRRGSKDVDARQTSKLPLPPRTSHRFASQNAGVASSPRSVPFPAPARRRTPTRRSDERIDACRQSEKKEKRTNSPPPSLK